MWLRDLVVMVRLVSHREDASAHGQRGLLACDSGNLDLKPEAQTCAEVLPRRTGRLIGPPHLLIPSNVDDRIIKLDTVRRSEICVCKSGTVRWYISAAVPRGSSGQDP